jgi:hypothetical protein
MKLGEEDGDEEEEDACDEKLLFYNATAVLDSHYWSVLKFQ